MPPFHVSHIIKIPAVELPVIHKTVLHDYYFLWGEQQNQAAIALGYGSLFNHSYDANAYFNMDLNNETMDFYSASDIEAGEEIFVNYNGEPNDSQPVWFDQNKEKDRRSGSC